MPRTAEAEADKATPVHTAKKGLLNLAVWEYRYQTEDGNEGVGHNLTLERSYRDKEGKWQKTKIQLGDRDLGYAQALIHNAQQFLIVDETA